MSINGRYILHQQLGEGGMGTVHLATDRLTQTQVALKQVHLQPHVLQQGVPHIILHDTHLALAKEFRLLASLRHPHIVSVLDYGFDNDLASEKRPFFTMTYLPNAQTILEAGQNQSLSFKLSLIQQLLQAIAYLHRRDILHHDIKPANILVSDGVLRVLDFGLASNGNKQGGFSGGTPLYIPLEIWEGHPFTKAADLYAVGVIAYELLAGEHPFAPMDDTILDRLIEGKPNLAQLGVNAVATQVISCLLANKPEQRYATANEALLALADALRQPLPAETKAIRESYLQAAAFVGRKAELNQLQELLAQTKKGQGQSILIGGESGAGKSRLLNEIHIHALVDGFVVLRGQGVEKGSFPFQLWRNIIRHLLLIVEVTDFQAGVLKDVIPDINILLDRDIPPAPKLTGRASNNRLVLTIVDLLREVQQPILLLLEDLQWAVESLAPIQQILSVQAQLPTLMIAANYRSDEAPTLPDTLASMTHIKLGPLKSHAIKVLSQSILGQADTSESLIQFLESESEGNTFFIIETMRALAEESGHLQQVGQTPLPATVLTGGMQAVMRRRLNKVPTSYQALQTLAAVSGRQIDISLLAPRYKQTEVETWLTHAAEYDVVAIQENQWQFAHDKLRETLIADIPNLEKQPLHRAAAEMIEAVYADDAAYHNALLIHWREAGDLDKELTYLNPVAENMIDIQGAYEAAQAHLENALNRLPAKDPRAIPLLNWLARLYEKRGQYVEGTNIAEQARQLAKHMGNMAEEATSLKTLGIIQWRQGAYVRATDLYQQSLAIRQQLGNPSDIAESLNNLGIIAYGQGAHERATDLYQQSLAIHQQLGDQLGIAASLNNLGIIAYEQGTYGRANELYKQSLALNQQLNNQHGTALSLDNLGIVAYKQGAYERAIELHQQSLAINQRLGNQHGRAVNLNHLGHIAYKQEAYNRAGNWFVQALTITHQINAITMMLQSLLELARMRQQRGQSREATQLIGLINQHSVQNAQLRQGIDKCLSQLEAHLSPNVVAVALEEGARLDLDTVVGILQVEFGEVKAE